MSDLTTKEKVLALWKEDSFRTQVEIARLVGVSRERVRQLFNTLGIRKAIFPKTDLVCATCGTLVAKNKYCSPECRKAGHYTIGVCTFCGKNFPVRNSDWKARQKHNKSGKFFCGKPCQGKQLAKEFGFKKKLKGSKSFLDTGCEFSPACLDCLLPQCKEEITSEV